jgi:hypothetical protein
MELYVLEADRFEEMFGTPDAPTPKADVVLIGQRPDCSGFLVLSDTAYPQLVPQSSIPAGFDLTYCQAWGLTINAEVVARVKKCVREKRVGEIVVTTSTGKVFDGDETSQTRMTRTILAMSEFGVFTTSWRMADNSDAVVTREELAEALLLSGTAQASLWFV